jgi:hypothetical protein
MRASKLVTLSAVAVLMGGADLALAASPQTSGSMQGSGGLHAGQGIGSAHQGIGSAHRPGVYGRANEHELSEAGITAGEHTRAREIMRDIPQLSNIGNTQIRIDGYVTPHVRQAAAPLPPDVRRMHPRFRNDRAFIYRDQVVIVNPVTSRIVALIKKPA